MKIIGIIGGTGVYSPDLFESSENICVHTIYGEVNLLKAVYRDNIIYFLERHGSGHKTAPHLVNYKANIEALRILKVDFIFATAAVGSLNKNIPPGCFVIIDQFLDFTKNRPCTFFDEGKGVVHIDMSEPYCRVVRAEFISQCKKLGFNSINNGTYVCTEGPRFENKAEINMYKILGGHVVGMTNYPEVVLAREANLCYGTVGIVTNYATGISLEPLTHKEVMDNMKLMSENIKKLFINAIESISISKICSCNQATKELGSIK